MGVKGVRVRHKQVGTTKAENLRFEKSNQPEKTEKKEWGQVW